MAAAAESNNFTDGNNRIRIQEKNVQISKLPAARAAANRLQFENLRDIINKKKRFSLPAAATPWAGGSSPTRKNFRNLRNGQINNAAWRNSSPRNNGQRDHLDE